MVKKPKEITNVENVIELENLTKKYDDFTAVDNVSFKVSEGEIFGFLGPNGAGKTTTVSILTTLKRKTSGIAKINGYDIDEESKKVRSSIGIVFQEPSLDEELTVYENLKFHALMYEMDSKTIEKRIGEMLKLVGLTERKKNLVKNLSGGMKRRLEIARGFMHHPKVLFLDEPTVGLDPQTRLHIWDYVRRLNQKENVTVVLTTHHMEEAESLANRIAIMDEGKIIALDKPKKLKKIPGKQSIYFKTSNPEKLASVIEKINGVSTVKVKNNKVYVNFNEKKEDLSQMLDAIIKSGCDIKSISAYKPTLEDVYIKLTGKRIRDEGDTKKNLTAAKIKR
ncbi:MAG: ATP-binding cassette domain-containing protein [Nanoarchaeota archaeon]